MRGLILSALAGAALILSAHAVLAADGSELIASCKEQGDAGNVPPGVTTDTYVAFCTCLVREAGDDQDVIDEHLAISKATGEEQQELIANSSDKASAGAEKCADETGMVLNN